MTARPNIAREPADQRGRDRCPRCGHTLLWVDGRLVCLWRPCVEAEDQR
jgi:hypothetical protein